VDPLQSLFVCTGVPLLFLTLILCIVLFAQLADVRQQLKMFAVRLGHAEQDLLNMRLRADQGAARAAVAEALGRQTAAPSPPPPAPVPLAEPSPPAAAAESLPVPPPVQPQPQPVTVPLYDLAPPPAPPTPPAPSPASAATPEEAPVPEMTPTAEPEGRGAAASPQVAPAAERSSTGPAAKPGLEAYLGTRLFVVVGAIALALAGILLVKYAVDRNYFNPAVRVVAGAVAGLALLGTAQWRRRHEPFIAQGLSAAGVVALFAAVFAATSLYHFLPPLAGFALLATVTAIAVALSLQKEGGGPLLATLGLLGGFVTPLLVRTDHPNVPGLFSYLLLLHVGMVSVSRFRGWTILSALSVLFSSLWLLAWLAFMPWNPDHGPVLGAFMLASVIALVVATVRDPVPAGGGVAATALTWLSGGLGLLAACLLLGKSGFSNVEWSFFAALVAGAFVLGRLRRRYEGLAWVASAAVLAMLAAWAGPGHRWLPAADLPRLPWLVGGFGVGTVLAAYGCHFGRRNSAASLRWAVCAVLLALAYVGVAYAIVGSPPRADAWAFVPLAAATATALLAIPAYARRRKARFGEETVGVFAHGVLALLFISPPMALTDGALTAAWCGLFVLAAAALGVLRIPSLVGGFLAVFAVTAFRAFTLGWMQNAAPDGATVWWNPIVWTYGGLLLACIAAVWLLERAGRRMTLPPALADTFPGFDGLSSLVQVAAVGAAFFLLTLEVRWFFHAGDLSAAALALGERSMLAAGWLALACGLVWLGDVRRRLPLVRCGEVVGGAGLAYCLAVLCVFGSPLLWNDDVGGLPVLNALLYVYGLPAALCAAMAYLLSRSAVGTPALAKVAGAVSLFLLFVLATLDVRQGFVGGRLQSGSVVFTEWATYPVVWLALGAAALEAGRFFRRPLVAAAGGWFAAAGACALVMPVLVASPLAAHVSVGRWPVVNDLLYVYGAPLALCAWLVWRTRPRGLDRPQLHAGLHAAAMILLTALAVTEVRQAFQGEYLNALAMSFVERGTYPLVGLALGGALLWLGRRWKDRATEAAGVLLAMTGVAFSVVVCGVGFNPLARHESVGTIPVFNWVLYVFALPALGAGLLARALDARGGAWVAPGRAAAVAGLLLAFACVSLEVRQFFQGAFLDAPGRSYGETLAYSLAWAALGAAFLTAGIIRRSMTLRWASLVVMLLTILKVFLFDMAHLHDLLRVLSFAGLGLSLMALAFVYQHFVFRRAEAGNEP
jgi:uncharacterized membrane protein